MKWMSPGRVGAAPSETTPIWYTLPACCASAASGTLRRPPAKIPMKTRRSITRSRDPPAAGTIASSSGRAPCGLEVDHELELGGLLDGQVRMRHYAPARLEKREVRKDEETRASFRRHSVREYTANPARHSWREEGH